MNNTEQYERIKNKIELFEAGKLTLQALIGALKSGLSIEGASTEWLRAFHAEWWELEQLNAYTLDQKERGIITDYDSFVNEPSNRQNVSNALKSMKKLLEQAQIT